MLPSCKNSFVGKVPQSLICRVLNRTGREWRCFFQTYLAINISTVSVGLKMHPTSMAPSEKGEPKKNQESFWWCIVDLWKPILEPPLAHRESWKSCGMFSASACTYLALRSCIFHRLCGSFQWRMAVTELWEVKRTLGKVTWCICKLEWPCSFAGSSDGPLWCSV